MNCKLIFSSRSQLFHSRRFFSSQAKLRSTIQRLGMILKVWNSAPERCNAVQESARQIWLASLGAFAKAQQEGGKVFEALVKEGRSMQRKTQTVAEEKISGFVDKVTSMASDIQSKAGNRWDKLENIFKERVAKAMSKLGVPSAHEVSVLTASISHLKKTNQK